MLKKILFGFVAILVISLLSNCSNVYVASNVNGEKVDMKGSTPVANVVSMNYGCYLFSWLPIACGDSSDPYEFHMFKDTVTVDGAYAAMTNQAKILGSTKVIDVTSYTAWYPNPYTFWILWYKTVNVSGIAVN